MIIWENISVFLSKNVHKPLKGLKFEYIVSNDLSYSVQIESKQNYKFKFVCYSYDKNKYEVLLDA